MIIAVQAGHVRLDLIPDPPRAGDRWTIMRLHERLGEAHRAPTPAQAYIARLGHPHHAELLDTYSTSPSIWDAAGLLAEQLYRRETAEAAASAERAARKGWLVL